MKKLSSGQLKAASEITGNIGVAWFSVGTISPLFTHPEKLWYFLFNFLISLIMAFVFSVISLYLVKGVRL